MKTKKAKTRDNKPIQARLFTGISDLTKWIESTKPDEGWFRNHADPDASLDFKLCGAHSYQEARSELLKGKNINEIKRAIPKGTVSRTTKKRGLDVIGGCPNVPAYLAGNPQSMYRYKAEKTKGAYNVFVDTSIHCKIKKSQVREAGIEILLKVLQLSNKYPVNLYAGNTAIYNDKITVSMTKIIDAGKPFNIARISYALTEPAFLRVFGLAVIERSGGFWDSGASSGYGRPVRNNAERLDVVSNVLKNAIVVSTLDAIERGSYALNAINKALETR